MMRSFEDTRDRVQFDTDAPLALAKARKRTPMNQGAYLRLRPIADNQINPEM
jgi:hypothetical protein